MRRSDWSKSAFTPIIHDFCGLQTPKLTVDQIDHDLLLCLAYGKKSYVIYRTIIVTYGANMPLYGKVRKVKLKVKLYLHRVAHLAVLHSP